MSSNIKIVRKCYFERNGVLDTTAGYDWISNPIFGLYPVVDNEHLGFVNEEGTLVIPIKYDVQSDFRFSTRDYLVLRKNDKYGIVRHDGSEFIPFIWNEMNFCLMRNNALPVSKDGKWGYIDITSGKMIIPPQYDGISFFGSNGIAPVCIKVDGTEKWGFVDVNGHYIMKPSSLFSSSFEHGFAMFYKGDRQLSLPIEITNANCGVIDEHGRVLIDGFDWIQRSGPDVFICINHTPQNRKISTMKQLVSRGKDMLVITNGSYVKGWVSSDGTYSKEMPFTTRDAHLYDSAKYIGGGSISIINSNGDVVRLSNKEQHELQEELMK